MLKTNGSLWAMGDNGLGNLGNGGDTSPVNIPTQIGTATDWNSISTSLHTCAIKSNGTLWAWGANGLGQLGDGTTINKNIPIQVGVGTNWLTVETGFNHTIALSVDHTLYSWGWNNYGQLGDGTFIDKIIPTRVGSICSLGTDGFTILKSLQVYPNPTANNGTISYTLSENKTITLLLLNSLGQLVHQEKITGKLGENLYQIDMNTYSAGLYLVTLKAGDDSVTVKLIKQ
jgi:hypothetical protein